MKSKPATGIKLSSFHVSVSMTGLFPISRGDFQGCVVWLKKGAALLNDPFISVGNKGKSEREGEGER